MYEPGRSRELAGHYLGLANSTRIRIVEVLARVAEINVNDLAQQLHMSQPRVSWHLRMLRLARVVSTRRDGREVFCSLDRTSLARYHDLFLDLTSGALTEESSEVIA